MSDPVDIDPLGATVEGAQAATAGLSESARRAIERDAQLRTGARLQHFCIDSLLGKGAMGAVYAARDESLDRDVALKVLPAELAADRVFIERFVREAQAQAKLNHPNVVPIYFIGEEQERWFFAMEKVDGESLDDVLDRGESLDWRVALDVAAAVASALGMAQEKGLIHRDIKPSNILATGDGTFKVADFGLAKPVASVSDTEKKLTQDGAFVGTPLYVAPEQARGEDVDHRVDMYALGATLFHLVAGRPVFDGNSLVAIVAKHASEAPRLEDLGATAEFRAFVGRLLAKARGDRFDSWADVSEMIDEVRPEATRPGAMASRYLANFVDFVLPLAAVSIVGGAVWTLAPLLFVYVVGATRIRGRTIGKWLFRLQVVGDDEGRPTWWQATVRTLLTWIPAWYVAVVSLMLPDTTRDRHYEGLEVFAAPPAELALFLGVLGFPVIMAIAAFVASRNRHNRTYADRAAETRVVQV